MKTTHFKSVLCNIYMYYSQDKLSRELLAEPPSLSVFKRHTQMWRSRAWFSDELVSAGLTVEDLNGFC